MPWKIKYYNEKLEKDILNLPDDLSARYLLKDRLLISLFFLTIFRLNCFRLIKK